MTMNQHGYFCSIVRKDGAEVRSRASRSSEGEKRLSDSRRRLLPIPAYAGDRRANSYDQCIRVKRVHYGYHGF